MSSHLSLHKAVFSGDFKVVEGILENYSEKELNTQDIHGNTALHIATMKGDKRCVEILVKKGAVTTIRNQLNWMSLHEAISYGDFDIIKILSDALSQRVVKYLKRDNIFKFVDQIKEDFVLKFEVRLKDYKPTTISNIDPELKIILTKKGLKMKADVIVMDCFHSKPQHFHFIFDVNPNNDKFIIITVGELPVYQTITFDNWEQTLTEIFSRESTDDEIRDLMSKENISIHLDWNSKQSNRSSFRKVVTRRLGGHRADIYEAQDIDLTTRVRTEHLRAREELAPSENERPHSLPQPTVRNVSWDQYINAPKGRFPNLGREIIETVDTNRVSVVIGLTEEIPLDWRLMLESIQKFLNNKVLAFISELFTQLPKGFPVAIDLPVKASVYAKYKLISFKKVSDIDDSIFSVPDSFIEAVIFTLERNTHQD